MKWNNCRGIIRNLPNIYDGAFAKFSKCSALDVWQDSEYISELQSPVNECNICKILVCAKIESLLYVGIGKNPRWKLKTVYERLELHWNSVVHGKTTHEWHTDDIQVHTCGYMSDIWMTYEYIPVTYGWNTSTYQWHMEDIRVHTSDIRMTYEYIRATYEWLASVIRMTCGSKEK